MDMREKIRKSIRQIPVVEGPVMADEQSYPFCDMLHSRVPLNVADYGYVEEEFFLSGTANVYDTDAQDQVILYREALPYKNRILVRRPADPGKYTGRVYVDIMNATQGYDIEDLWHRNYLWCMEQGHAYIGITSKPINVLALKNFDYDRYKDLNWSNGEIVPMPIPSHTATVPGTEEGLFWDMLSQLAYLLRTEKVNNCLGGYPVEYIYLTGQSQSGAYLNTYVSYFDEYICKNGEEKGLFDGYLNIVGALVQRSIRQEGNVGPLRLEQEHMHPSKTPYISFSSEADLYLFNLFMEGNLLDIRIENSDTEDHKCRYYEIAASPHTDIICPVLTATSEIEKMGGKIPNLDPRLLDHINNMRIEYYVCGMLEKLHIWATDGIAPEVIEPLKREGGDLVRDEYGHAIGGLCTPYIDLPIARYIACNPDDPEGICGKMEYFTEEEFVAKYGNADHYHKKLKTYLQKQVDSSWLTQKEADIIYTEKMWK